MPYLADKWYDAIAKGPLLSAWMLFQPTKSDAQSIPKALGRRIHCLRKGLDQDEVDTSISDLLQYGGSVQEHCMVVNSQSDQAFRSDV